jgi:hypothetical protein
MCVPIPDSQVIAFLQPAFRLMCLDGALQVVYEDCYFSRNAKTYAKLYHLKECTAEAAAGVGLAFYSVAPSIWQSALLLNAGESSSGVKRAVWKRRAAAYASRLIGGGFPQDVYDARCLWEYWSVTGHDDKSVPGTEVGVAVETDESAMEL